MGSTVAALATASGEGALAVIRISGPEAFAIGRALGAVDASVRSHRALVRRLTHDGELLDQAVVLPFRGPRSFTGEDVLELHVHGGRITAESVQRAVFALGASPAEPGEFSRRALLNGKLDLVQVEAIADVIHAQSESAQRLAQSHLAGTLSEAINELKDALFELVTLVEASIDFALEEHVYSITADEIATGLEPIAARLDRLLGSYADGRLRQDGVTVALIGRPNAGKSSLLNAVLGEDRAIVTDVPGTTRDTIRETIAIDGVQFHLVDTAGLRKATDRVESLGVERTKVALETCDIAVVVVAATDRHGPDALISMASDRPCGVLVNKIDLGEPEWPVPPLSTLRVSALHGDGISHVEGFLNGLAKRAGLGASTETALLTRERHRATLATAGEDLERAREAAEMGLGHELIAVDLRSALDHLGTLTGAITDDDILNRIFGDFCVGK